MQVVVHTELSPFTDSFVKIWEQGRPRRKKTDTAVVQNANFT